MNMHRQHSIVPHKDNYFFLMLEDDYLAMYEEIARELDPIKEQKEEKLSGPSDCKAMIAASLEAWMNSKRATAKDENGLFVYNTYDEWEFQLRYRYKRSTIIQCLKEMEAEGRYIDEKGVEHIGTIKRRPYVQNTFEYQLNLPVIRALFAQLPEQSPFAQKPRAFLGRPKKNRVETDGFSSEENRPKINGLNKNGLSVHDGSVKTNDSRVKTNARFYTQITEITQNQVTVSAEAPATTDFLPSFEEIEEPPSTLPIAESTTHTQAIESATGFRFPGTSAFRKLGTSATIPTIPSSVRKPPVTPIRLVPPTPKSAAVDSHPGYRKETEDAGMEQQQNLSAAPPETTPTKGKEQQQNLVDGNKGKGSRARKKKEVEPPPPPLIDTLSPEAKRIWRDWCSLFTVEVELGQANANAAEKLVKAARVWCPKLKFNVKQLLKDMKDHAFEADKSGYYTTRGVKLFDLPREMEGWQSAKERQLEVQTKATQRNGSTPRSKEEDDRALIEYLASQNYAIPPKPEPMTCVLTPSQPTKRLRAATS